MNSVLWTLVTVLLVFGVSGVGADEESVFVMEQDSVTLHTNIEANHQEKMRWYFKDFQIAAIIGEKREICTEDQCKERFRDRLKLDHQTGSLTITNITNTDSGVYKRKVINSGSVSDRIFNVSVHGVSAAERDKMKGKSVKEGESVTLDPGVVKNLNGVMTWYFSDILMAEITGDQSEVCTDDQCKERFSDRLKLDHQAGSLNITNTRTTDSGEYKLQINSRNGSFSISRISTVLTVIDSGLSPGAIAGIVVVVVVVVVLLLIAAVFLYRRARRRNTQNNRDQEINLEVLPPDQSTTPFIPPEANASNWTANGNHV
ncbi:carcinoembryonic antigen-related cell adhesion molecule 1-like [Sinocyclocheilus grahami]|uniref:carcinoembryonic antigen-related cell adhesion molecule 1-like n=1 Tax=Sinocyclocheilus grahami TaxID=75366 RepID=UPI0007ACFFF6|nr:PREDICTED: carcinoembryonic antigen-related cell adhesion molecule 1-like [Sinocyclocheilus grahami]